MYGFKFSQNRKKVQRAVNRTVRALNRNITEDNLWRGRFVVYQSAAWWMRTDDKYRLIVELVFKDKKTGQSTSEIMTANRAMFFGGEALYKRMNDFIIHESGVWVREGLDAIRNDTTDYTKIGR